ncbi:MAG: metalloregulator ArsR/SmtB family transcription factor [Cyanobacteria bacterium P01_G01_bin.38]
MIVHNIHIHDVLSVLGDPVRLKILDMLKKGHEQCKDINGYVGIHVSDITKAVEISQPAVSKHLAKLRDVGLVQVERKGQRVYYRRNEDMIDQVKSAVAEL